MSKKAIQLWLNIKREYPIGSYVKVLDPNTKVWVLSRVVAYSSEANDIAYIRLRPIEYPNQRIMVLIESLPCKNIIKHQLLK